MDHFIVIIVAFLVLAVFFGSCYMAAEAILKLEEDKRRRDENK